MTETLQNYGKQQKIDELRYLNTPKSINDDYDYQIVHVATTLKATLFVIRGKTTGYDYIYGCGDTSAGLFQVKEDSKIFYRYRRVYPQLVHSQKEKIKKLVCGDDFCLFLSENGIVYSWFEFILFLLY